MNDVELVAAVAAGEDTALRELLRRHAPWLSARLQTAVPACDVEDVIQETFIAVWRGAAAFRPEVAVGGWIWGIARRQAALLLRRRGPVTWELPPDSEGYADPANAAANRADFDEAVAALGPPGSPEREALRLMYVEDRSVAEVAELMGVPAGTVKSRAHRARRLLRAALQGRDDVEGGGR